MFTGDIGFGTSHINDIKRYTSQFGISYDVDVLKYPHHGNSTVSDNLLNTITPEYVIVPNFRSAKYPNSSNISRLRKFNIKTYRQSDSKTGNIYLKSDGNNITIKMDY
jgi:beta-lactamase superfamily II metal-dependent hydrolase